MLRNHAMGLDPESRESSPQRQQYQAYQQPESSPSEDPWFSHNGRESPLQHTSAGPPSFNQQGTGWGDYSASSGGHMGAGGNARMGGGAGALNLEEDFDNEPPLLEELGIRFDHILAKTRVVINPRKQISEHILDDADLAGPLFFCLLLGACMLLSGKVHFGYIYGFSVCGCASLNAILNLIHHTGLDFWRTCSVLGYCLIPVIGLAAVAIIINLQGALGIILSVLSIGWSTISATRLFDAKLQLTDQYYLVMYPISLLYSCFVLITIF